MSDFDDVLERLVTDPAFPAALRADAETALRDYRLDPQERALLESQLDLSAGADHAVEDRVSKSGVFGLVGPVVSGFGLGAAVPEGSPVFGMRSDGGPGDPVASFGQARADGQGVFGTLDTARVPGSAATDYHTWVDADGDGRGDAYRAVERGDGGVDLYIDQDGDRVVDFVGHDYDRDGLVDNADYDTDGDGILDTRMDDVNGDGWLDRRMPYPAESRGTFGTVAE